MPKHVSTPAEFITAPSSSLPDTLWIYSYQGRFSSSATRNLLNFLGTWVEEDLSFLFFTQPAENQVRDLEKACPWVQRLDNYRMSYMDWIGGELTPFSVGRLHIRPLWALGSAPAGMQKIDLDPGVVFGGGTHQTTLDCLKGLNLFARNGVTGRLVDIGCGTGILALAAARLGWGQVVAFDLNPLAAWTSKANVERNELADRVLVVQGRAEDALSIPAHTLVANIHYDIMAQIVQKMSYGSTQKFILSGLLRSQAREIRDRLRRLGFWIDQILDDGTWFTLLGYRQSFFENLK